MIIAVISVVAILLVSCVPTEPQDMLPYCKVQYELLLDQDANFPEAFIGYCVASNQTDRATAYQPLCNYEPLWQMITENTETTVTSKSECLQYFRNLD